jgi:ATP-dependent protease ClpP protease subunit
MSLYHGDKKKAACNLAVEGAAVYGALRYRKHPVLGYLGGMAAGLAATYFVPGSPSREAYDEWKSKH